ncbi:MAG: hypothetical protein M1818_003716 [Claussenomyces sp. TS43310]|nr:MAG: hypothetical protein M1818_003716 [Claussenomyces sp. TS43310]
MNARHSEIYANLIVNDKPEISTKVTQGDESNTADVSGAVNWPLYSAESPLMVVVNETNVPYVLNLDEPFNLKKTISAALCPPNPDSKNWFRVANTSSWEGGRGARCNYWQSIAPRLPQ